MCVCVKGGAFGEEGALWLLSLTPLTPLPPTHMTHTPPPTRRLDLHLGEHIESLYSQIRQRAITQYVTPFTSVDLHTMARAFNTSVG